MKKIQGFAALVLGAAFFLAGCGSTTAAGKPVVREAGKAYNLVILHTNDQHGQVLPTSDGKGGLASQATFVKQVRAANENVLVLSAGDINTGTALSNMFDAEPDLAAYNAIGYDAAALGNHEFDKPLSVLLKQIAFSKFQWISANIKQGNKYFVKPYIIKNYDGFRVAVIGATTCRTKVIASPDKSLTLTDEIEAIKENVKICREKEMADLVVVVGHLGDILETNDQNTSIKLAEQVSGIDLIVDGHAHSYFAEPNVVNGTPIVSANEKGKYVGEADFTIVDGKIQKFQWKPVEITTTAFAPDPAVETLLKPYVDKANASLKEVVLKTTAPFEFGKKLTRYQEMASGDYLTDAMVAYCKKIGVNVDFAVTNGGGIRADLPAGDVTREQIMTMLPFENYVYVVTLKGSDVVELFNFIGQIKQGAGAFAQVSKGVSYTINYDANGNGTIADVLVNGKAIDPAATYKIAVNDYNAKGGDGYVALTKSVDTFNTSMILSDVFIDYVTSLGTVVTPKVDNRIKVVGGKLPQ